MLAPKETPKTPFTKDFEPVREGLFNLTEWVYRRIKALNITYAKLFNRSAAHVYTAIHDPEAQIIKPTYAMDQGTGFHWLALEPERFANQVVADNPISKKSNEYKHWKQAQAGKLILKAEDIEKIKKMVSVMRGKKSAMQYISSGWREKAIIWYEPDYDIWCKGRIDWIRDDGQVLVDLKKTQIATRWAFEGAIRRYDYYKQAAHYMRGFAKVMGYRPKEWVWIASEIEAPNECNVFVADPDEIESAEADVENWYQRYHECEVGGYWPGYPDEPVYLGYEPIKIEEEIEEDEFSYF